ncbi:MAG: Type 1 glutamine amidotransferase-like domain-containing protein [Candidatus Cloacimonetes bacterium]|nr:Type 1 glutamine amidotransferase-like domain-containing protein [Candidatus Cloacimonadota bacterium]
MRKLYLFGDCCDNFRSTCRQFILAAGGSSAEIALLMQGERNWKESFTRYRDLLHQMDIRQVWPVFPKGEECTLSNRDMENIEHASGILMTGGYTYRYIKIYTENEISSLIESRYRSGIPFAGVSAGAILSIRLGFLPNAALKPHFSEKKRFTELINKMISSKSGFGFGIDDGICVQILEEKDVEVYGKGRLYLLKRMQENQFECWVLTSGSKFSCDFRNVHSPLRF